MQSPVSTPRICRVIARLNVGGPAKHVVWLTAAAQDCGFDCQLICGEVPAGEEDMSCFAAQHNVHPLTIRHLSREISWRDALAIWKLFRLFRQLEPDIVHTHTAKAGTVGRLAGLLYRWLTPPALWGRPRRCQVVHTYHGHVLHSYYGRAKTRLFITIEKCLARLATDRIVVISPQQLDELHLRFHIGRANQFTVIPLGLDLTQFDHWRENRSTLRQELSAGDDEVLVGIVGRLTEIKNHFLFLLAAGIYKSLHGENTAGPRVRFVIIGDGHLRSSLEQQVRALELTDDVIFLGSRSDPERFYAGLDIIALTSLNEGTPLSLIEAMANRRPVISTRVGGVPDLLGPLDIDANRHSPIYQVHERGLSVDSNHPLGLSQGLGRLIADPLLRDQLAERGHSFVHQHHSKQRLLTDITALYRDLLTAAA